MLIIDVVFFLPTAISFKAKFKSNLTLLESVSNDKRHLFEILYFPLNIFLSAFSILSIVMVDKNPRLPAFIPTIGISRSFT